MRSWQLAAASLVPTHLLNHQVLHCCFIFKATKACEEFESSVSQLLAAHAGCGEAHEPGGQHSAEKEIFCRKENKLSPQEGLRLKAQSVLAEVT